MTELVWDGKYDKEGRKVTPVRIELPFQTVETVNESAQERQRALEFFTEGRQGEWRNRLIWGDKKYVLPSLLNEFAGQVDLIYIDPPFDTGANFSFTTTIPESDENFTKEPSIIEQKAYRDTWGVSPEERRRGVSSLDKYARWLWDTVVMFDDLLSETGSLYVHLDWHVVHYAKAVLDEVFGAGALISQDEPGYRGEIVWCYKTREFSRKYWNRKHDSILYYTKGSSYTFNWEAVLSPLSEVTIKKYRLVDDNGKRYRLCGRGITGSPIRSAKDVDPEWERTHPELVVRDYLREGYPPEDWWVIDIVNQAANERVDYATQKPEALLERIIKASSNEGDLVLDCFVGSGTTAAVAEKLNRRWIACDLSRFAIHTTRKRLLSIPNVRPFVVQNLGKYERQTWQKAEFENPEDAQVREAAYRRFILDLYHADALMGYAWLHGLRAGRFVHVGTVDAPITLDDVRKIAAEVWQTAGSGQTERTEAAVDILGWEFAFELNEMAIQMAAEARVDLKFKHIPREVMDKKAVEQGDVHFYELAALGVDLKQNRRTVTLELTDFIMSPENVPEEVQRSIRHWEQWIDYWAVDWDYRGDAFHNQWQSYRTRKDPGIQRRIAHKYEESGQHVILVKVIDLFGNDTTKSLTVEVK